MRIGVVFNPKSGRRRGDGLYRIIESSIVGSGHTLVVVDVVHGKPLEDAVARAVSDVDVIAVIGGDGTLNGVVNGILSSAVPGRPVAFFPAGRGMDAARSIPTLSVDLIANGPIDWTRTSSVDVGRVTAAGGVVRYFINAGDIGLIGAAAGFAARLPRQIGAASYVLGAVYGFLVTRPTTATMILDGEREIELDRLLSIAVCNGKAFGGGIHLAPEASVNDGLLDIVAVRNANLLDLLTNLPKLKRGTLIDHPALSRWRARSVLVTSSKLGPADLDGEMWGETPLTYTVHPSALNWIGPRT